MAPSGDASKPAFSPLETYLRYGLAGATCATTAHTVLVPMDVVKTRLQVTRERRELTKTTG